MRTPRTPWLCQMRSFAGKGGLCGSITTIPLASTLVELPAGEVVVLFKVCKAARRRELSVPYGEGWMKTGLICGACVV